MIQTILVFIIFFAVVTYQGVKLFRKKKPGQVPGSCAKCAAAGKVTHHERVSD